MSLSRVRSTPSSDRGQKLQVGFVPLIDAAPLIVADELSYFEDEGLDVQLQKQIGWGNVRDRLTYGELHASHAPLGMIPASLASVRHYEEPLGMLMSLSSGGNAITISRELAGLGDGPTAPAAWRRQLGRPIRLAYVISVATHYSALCQVIQSAGLLLDRDVNFCVLPPSQMPGLLERGTIDGFCAGDPWNTLAATREWGSIFRATTELFPDHPEKVLAVTRKWFDQNPATAQKLARATQRGCDFCNNPANYDELASMLARYNYLGVDKKVLLQSLKIDSWLRTNVARPRFRTFGSAGASKELNRIEWSIGQMIRWKALPSTANAGELTRHCLLSEPELVGAGSRHAL